MQLPPHEVPAFVSDCLSQGFAQHEIAAALGVSESYISQILAANPSIAQNNGNAAFTDIDALYADIELTALQELKKKLNLIKDPMALLRLATSINATKRRSVATDITPTTVNQTVVQLTLPRATLQQFVFNSNNQAVAIQSDTETKPLVTATAGQLESLAAARAKRLANVDNAQLHNAQRLANVELGDM